jgi:hypothetical protein
MTDESDYIERRVGRNVFNVPKSYWLAEFPFSARTRNILAGEFCGKENLLAFMRKNGAFALRGIKGLGLKGYIETLQWLGVSDKDFPSTDEVQARKASPEEIQNAIKLLTYHGYTVQPPNLEVRGTCAASCASSPAP